MLSHFSRVWFFAALWTIACQAPLFMRFSRQEYWSGLHALLQGIFPTELTSLTSPALAGTFFTTSTTWEAQLYTKHQIFFCLIIPKKTLNIYFYLLFIWLCQVLDVACRIFSCSMLLVVACGIEFPNQESNPGPLRWECSTLAIRPPRNSPHPPK